MIYMKSKIQNLLVLLLLLSMVKCKSGKIIKSDEINNNTKSQYYGHRNPLLFIHDIKIYAQTKVTAISLDSIFVDITFHNESDSDFLLYKKLLPSNPLQLDVFSIIEELTFKNINFIGDHDTLVKTYFYNDIFHKSPSILPDQNPYSYVILHKKDSLSYKINIAKFYDFKEMLKSGKTNFKIAYLTQFPYVLNYKHIYNLDIDEKLKPVYYFVGPKVKYYDEFPEYESFTLKDIH